MYVLEESLMELQNIPKRTPEETLEESLKELLEALANEMLEQ